MEIVNKKLDDLKPYENNPRFNDDAVEYVAKSIKEFGFKVPIVIDKNNVIVAGHTRYKASMELGLEEVPCVVADDLTDEQIRAFRLADNKVAEIAEWDIDLLDTELDDILNIDMSDFGFDLDFEDEKEIIEDEVPEVPEEPKAKLGDIYQLGNHRLMCGDSTNVENINKLLNGNKIDMVYTDAPYGISIVNDKTHKVGAGNLAKNKEYLQVKGDDTTDTAKKFYNNCVNIGIDNFILWGGNYFTDFLPFSPSWLIWDKRVDMNSNNFADGEMAWCSFKTPVRIYHQLWNGMIREGEHEDRVHPTQKPVRMQIEILKDFTNENDNIFDGFGGSGSTLMACEQTNRNCYMIEYEPSYIDLIIQRWENFTGEKAIKLN
jgi:site-specific DNA-methyltransferase (adenine-specific)